MLLIIPVTLFLIPANVQAASQISPKDGLWLSLPPDSVKCVALRLPQDAGLPMGASYVFTVIVEPEPSLSWSDLSEQKIYDISENNTALIPICFDTAGSSKLKGNCSEPYTMILEESYTSTRRSWSGGTCVSSLPDVDIVPDAVATDPDDIEEILSDNTDLFAAWLDKDEAFTLPGRDVILTLFVQSQDEFDIQIKASSSLLVTPGQASLSTSEDSQHRTKEFSVKAPAMEGTYPVTFSLSPTECSGESFCTKTLVSSIVVSRDEPPEKTGYRIEVMPENIDVARDRPVFMRFTIYNNEDVEKVFETRVVTEPSDAQSSYTSSQVRVPAKGIKTESFTVTAGTSRLYEVTAIATLGEIDYSYTSFITTGELMADADRLAHGLGEEYQDLVDAYGATEDRSLDEYRSLRDALSSATPPPEGNGTDNGTEPVTPPPRVKVDPFGWVFTAVPIALIGLAAAILIVYFAKKQKGTKDEDSSGEERYFLLSSPR